MNVVAALVASCCCFLALPAQEAGAARPSTTQHPAGDPMAGARQRLQKSLTTMQTLPSCGYTARWGPKDEGGKAAGAGGALRVIAMGGVASGEARGAWSDDLLQVVRGEDETVHAGRRAIARGADGWHLRRERDAEGRPLAFTPDPELLLDLLATMDLALLRRDVGTLDDRPVEILTATLNADQVADAFWSGAVPASGSPGGGIVFMAMAGAAAGAPGGAKPPAPPKPEGVVDVAFWIDPVTNHLLRVHVRSHTAGAAAARFGGAGGAVIVVNGGVVEEEKEEEEAEAGKDAPLQFEDGLPLRKKKDTTQVDYDLRFTDHGTAKAPALDAQGKRLLGR